MKKWFPILTIVLVACGRLGSADSVDSLVSNPERLDVLREQCKIDRQSVGDELCSTVAEAARKRFMGSGTAPYTPPKEQPKF